MPDFKLPDLGEGMTEAEVDRWLVSEGDVIAEDDPLVEVVTDKATAEIGSPFAGEVTKIHVPEGEVVPVGTVLVTIGEPVAAPASQTPAPAPAPQAAASPAPAAVKAMPPVRKLARALGVELAGVTGSGPDGRILRSDVERHAGTDAGPPAPAIAAPAPAASGGRREPLRGIRRTIADRMAKTHATIPAVTHVEECDVTELDATRRLVNERRPQSPKVTFLPFVVKAVVAALRDCPALNASLDDERAEIVYHSAFDIGIAVDAPGGLMVPVVRDADRKSLLEIAAEIARLADGARAGTLAPDELRGGTFTITSPGRHAGLMATPLILHPQTGILGVHKAVDRPVVRGGQIVVRRMMNVGITFDHRVLDGVAASRFCQEVVALLEHPAVLAFDQP